jgi:hypothetical protein
MNLVMTTADTAADSGKKIAEEPRATYARCHRRGYLGTTEARVPDFSSTRRSPSAASSAALRADRIGGVISAASGIANFGARS